MAPIAPLAVDAEPERAVEVLRGPRVTLEDAVVERLRSVCAGVTVDERARLDCARDWWPLTIRWAVRGAVPARPAVVCRPDDAVQVAEALAVCHDARVPITPMAGRSGVCGASVPAFGGVALDLCGLHGVRDMDTTSLVTDVLPGTFGPDLEHALRTQGVTLGHWPQSMELSTVGGWLACRGAGQYSTRYGKIEDMVVGLEVAMADGTTLRTGGTGPRAALGPDLTQLFVGSEGVLGVITAARLRVHRVPGGQGRRAFAFPSFATGLEACRRVVQRGATPAVLRLYDPVESQRSFGLSDCCVLVVLDEADPALLEACLAVVDVECAPAQRLDDAVVEQWLAHRNDVSQLAPLYRAGFVVDTIEIAARWSALHDIYQACVAGLQAVPGTLAASAHQSHAYVDGACLYFTFGGRMPSPVSAAAADHSVAVADSATDSAQDAWAGAYYARAWDRVIDEVLARGGAISHHHGIGINRARFVARALGAGLDVLAAVKDALDPRGILNPGKLGLPSPFGEVGWP